jgi:hypothetical protein
MLSMQRSTEMILFTQLRNRIFIVFFSTVVSTSVGCTDQSQSAKKIPETVSVAETANTAPAKVVSDLYTLKPGAAQVTVTTIKNGTIAVTGGFGAVVGSLQSKGQSYEGFVGVEAGTFDTNLPARDQNIRSAYFGITDNTTMQTVKLSVLSLRKSESPSEISGTEQYDLEGRIDMLGGSIPVSTTVSLAVSKSAILVHPVSLKLGFQDFGVTSRVEALRELCKHESIGPQFEVVFQGQFTRSVQ